MAFGALTGRAAGWFARAVRVTLTGGVVLVAFGAVAARVSIARASDFGMVMGERLLLVGDSAENGALVCLLYDVLLFLECFFHISE